MFKKGIIFLYVLFFYSTLHPLSDDHTSTTKDIIADVTQITDDIAELIINCKTEKDPQKTKAHVKSLVLVVANLVEIIIEKRKTKKTNRFSSVGTFVDLSSSFSSTSIDSEIEAIIHAILTKVNDVTS